MERLGNLIGNLLNWFMMVIVIAVLIIIASGVILIGGQIADQRIGFDEPLKYEVVETTDGNKIDTVYYYTIPGIFNR